MTRHGLAVISVIWLLASGCNSEIYLRDGVTDGDTFYLAERALADSDPVLQSWVSYSLTRSACQLQSGSDNPARASSFDCELTARRLMLDTWLEKKAFDPAAEDRYLDSLCSVRAAGYLDEYVARYLAKSNWTVPDNLQDYAFDQWAAQNLPGHRVETRITGSWNYARNVASFQ